MKREGGEKRSLLSIASQLSQVSPVLCDPAGQRESEHVCQTVFMLQKQEIGPVCVSLECEIVCDSNKQTIS